MGAAMAGRVRIAAERRGTGSVVRDCAGGIPLAPRVVPSGRAGWAAVALVQTAGGPLAGDELDVEIAVGPGARLLVFGLGATVALPADRPARQRLAARVHTAGRLWLQAAPLVLAAGCRLETALDLDLEAEAAALTEELVVLGRTGEEPGSLRGRLRCDLAARPLLRDELRIGGPPGTAAHRSPAVLGRARVYAGLALLGVRAPGPLQLEGPGTVARAPALDAVTAGLALADSRRGFADALAEEPQMASSRSASSAPSSAVVPDATTVPASSTT